MRHLQTVWVIIANNSCIFADNFMYDQKYFKKLNQAATVYDKYTYVHSVQFTPKYTGCCIMSI